MSWLNKTHCSAISCQFRRSVTISEAVENNSSKGVDKAVTQKNIFAIFDKTGKWHKNFYKVQEHMIFPILLYSYLNN